MILKNVKIAGSNKAVDIGIQTGLIVDASTLDSNTPSLHFDDAIVFAGLINSHDHLDFNLFPPMGNKIYNNYTEWGKHIHKIYKDEIHDILKIPVALRAQWGVYKNLLAGVTTIVNHGERLNVGNSVITVLESAQSLHSVRFQKNWKVWLNNPFKRKIPVNIHVGEGTDYSATQEIDVLTDWNFLHRELIGVHAVAMTKNQAKKFKAIVWCPESNYFLLNKTASVNLLKNDTEILFGTDSTLTGSWDIWDHIQLARKIKLLSDEELYNTLTVNPAKIWQLNSGEISIGKDADIVIAKNRGRKFFDTTPSDLLLVMHSGHIRLFDALLLDQLTGVNIDHYSKIYINNNCKYVFGDLPGLMDKIQAYNPNVKFPITLNPVA
jgi:cytosine/adenosine deaminase-related metal-dependent hydrolase